MSAQRLEYLLALAIGVAVAGMMASGWRLVTRRPATSRPMQPGARASTSAAAALILVAAPFIHVIGRGALEGRHLGVAVVAVAVAGISSLVSGTIVVMTLAALAIPAG